MKYLDLLKELNAKNYAPIYLLHGDANWHIDELTKKLETEVIDEGLRDFNLTILYGRDTSIETIVSAARRAPMMSAYQVVIVKEMQLLQGSIEGLIAYIEQPAATTILVLQYKGKKMNGNLKTTQRLKKSKQAIICEPKALKDYAIPGWIMQRVTSYKLSIDERTAHVLAEYVGADLAKVDNEIQKLRLNLKEGSHITEEDIERFTGISKDYNFFEMENAITQRNIAKSFKIVAYAEKNPKAVAIQPVITMLYRKFRDILIYHQNPSAIKTAPFLKKILVDASRKFSSAEAERAIQVIKKYDLRSKGVNNTGSTDSPMLMKEMVYELLM